MSFSSSHSSKSHLFFTGVASGFGIVRMITTRARAFYERRYKKKHAPPFARLIFVFDMALVAIIAILIGVILVQAIRSFAPPAYAVTFESGEMKTVSPVPIEASIRVSEKSGTHRNIRVFWKLPPDVEVIEAIPKLAPDGSVYIGTLARGQETRLHLVVRAYRSASSKQLTIGMQIQEGGFFDAHSTYASITKQIVQEGLTAEIPKELESDRVVARGAVLPIRIVNHTNDSIPLVEIRPSEYSTVDFPRQVFERLAPHEERFAYLPLGDLDSAPTLGWLLISAGHEIASGTWHADLIDWPNAPSITLAPIQKQNTLAHIGIGGVDDASIVILNPTVSSTAQAWNEKNLASVDVGIGAVLSPDRLAVIPMGNVSGSSSRILGPASFSLLLGRLPFTVSLRYTSVSGDQIGVGPNPPQPNQETRYWIFFKVDSPQIASRNLHVRAKLADNVSFTGLVATPDGGTFSVVDRTLDWKVASVESDQPSVMIGAEISMTPKTNANPPYTILNSASASIEDAETGEEMDAEVGKMTTEEVDRD